VYLLVIFLPLFGFILAGIFGRYIGSKGSVGLSFLSVFLSFLCSTFCFYETVICHCFVYISLNSWIKIELLNIDWGFMFDSLTSLMCCIVSFISTLVHLYSVEYMANDPHLTRFMSYLSLFTFFMLVLVTSDNFVQMFLGWEGVGLCSYLLINFWFTRIQANKAAIKAMVLNRVGDLGLILGILLIFSTFKSLDYSTVFSMIPLMCHTSIIFLNMKLHVLDLICFFIFVGAIGKSAQLGLHTWLPDAMEGPTPVSALIHAATMVTAGVFLLARCSCMFEYCFYIRSFIAVVGASTAFFAATVGLVQNDLKKVIAYSTCSQLGYMIFACGLSNYSVGVFHLSNHAFFKALLFLGAGSVIHAVGDEQDMRKMGGLKPLIPFTYSIILIGSLALSGFPFLTGFYSKDLILESAFGSFTVFGHYSYFLGLLSAFLTAYYSTRLLFLTFLSKPNGFRSMYEHAFDSSYFISIVLGLLTLPSIFVGFFSKDLLVGFGTDIWSNSIYVSPANMSLLDAEFLKFRFKIAPVFFSFLGISCCFFLYVFQPKFLFQIKTTKFGLMSYTFFNKKWYIDKIYAETFGQVFLNISYNITYKLVDRGVFEMLGPFGFTNIVYTFSNYLKKLQSGSLNHYVYIFLISIMLSLFFHELFFVLNSFGLTQQFLVFDFLKMSFLFILSLLLFSSYRLTRV
jgi:NADH-ubiquinone oxidoreductase chain 5